ncbi:MAG: MoaD/ThiS family protein [Acidimicrobiales bacterium]|nr:MoaD/ThiS family protein [Acidimicrobiales bacterium]
MIRVILPYHLANLAGVQREIEVQISENVSIESLLEIIESNYPSLLGTIRDQVTNKRRPFVRYFACQEDYSHLPTTTQLPPSVVNGQEPFIILGAISGG